MPTSKGERREGMGEGKEGNGKGEGREERRGRERERRKGRGGEARLDSRPPSKNLANPALLHTHCASVHQAAKLVAALLGVAGVTAGLAESNGILPPGL